MPPHRLPSDLFPKRLQPAFACAWGTLGLLTALALGTSCAQGSESAPPPAQSGSGGVPPSSPTAGAAAVAPPAAGTGGTAGAAPMANGGSSSTSTPSGSLPPPTDAAIDGCPDPETDGCAACVCRSCGAQLDTCAGIEGCSEILDCVLTSGCLGLDCYCGTESAAACLQGRSDGPCKEAVLAAPGGREPTLRNQSAGPATDAALTISECAEANDECKDLCGL